MFSVETILRYKMTPLEAKAYKIGCMWIELSRKKFPDYRHMHKWRKGDPRKSSLFNYCYKLANDEKIESYAIRLYIKAQLDILKSIGKSVDDHPIIDASIMVGEKSYKRWLVWKRRYDKVTAVTIAEGVQDEIHTTDKVIVALKGTKGYLSKKTELSKDGIEKVIKSIFRWTSDGTICGYYPLLSPLVGKWLTENKLDYSDVFYIDINYFKPGITDETKKYFLEEFSFEF